MGLFGFGKKKEENAVTQDTGNETILVLGGGCDACNRLENATKEALASLGMEEGVGHITDFSVIATYGVMSTPALVVDGKVVSSGKVPSVNDVAEMIKNARA